MPIAALALLAAAGQTSIDSHGISAGGVRIDASGVHTPGASVDSRGVHAGMRHGGAISIDTNNGHRSVDCRAATCS